MVGYDQERVSTLLSGLILFIAREKEMRTGSAVHAIPPSLSLLPRGLRRTVDEEDPSGSLVLVLDWTLRLVERERESCRWAGGEESPATLNGRGKGERE